MLLVDASQGVEAQTLANAYLAVDYNLEIIPVINKIDLPSAEPEEARRQLADIIGLDPSHAILTSAKAGTGVRDVLEAVIARLPPPAGDAAGPAEGPDLRLLVRRLPRRRHRRPRDRRRAPRAHEDPADGAGPGVRGRAGRRVHAEARPGGRTGRRRGRVLHGHHQEGERREARRHHHRGGPAGRGAVPRVPRAQADGLRRPVPGGGPRVPGTARRPREAAPERRLVLLRARVLDGAGIRLPVRLPRPAAHGHRAGAPRARVRPGPGHDGAGRAVPGDDDRRRGARDRQPGEAARDRPHLEVRGARHQGDDPHARRARRRHPAALPGQARHPEVARVPREQPRAHHLRAAVRGSRAGFLRPAEDDLPRVRVARLPHQRVLGVAAAEARDPRQRRSRSTRCR